MFNHIQYLFGVMKTVRKQMKFIFG